ncbi:PA3496 family putative envelope integrity protein, partial [uncultured Microbulbifer sp.]|uniref:PA3496 family putative envelope integrity protein n=1 Tax=uncultured Microbulbifer sp. TaxID=348147 RepID=UPI0025E28089
TTKTDKVFLPWQIEIMEFSMSGNVIENDIDFDEADSSVVGELLYTPDNPRDARRLVEDKLEEMRLRRELMDYQLDF